MFPSGAQGAWRVNATCTVPPQEPQARTGTAPHDAVVGDQMHERLHPMTDVPIVLCMKWGTLYPAVYVNVLYNAVRAGMSGPFRFVCLTDDAAGIVPDVDCHPIPDIGLAPAQWARGAWPKLSVFLPDLYGLRGRCLFVDLDTVVLGDLAPFLDRPGALTVIDSAPWRYRDAAPRAMTSLFGFEIGAGRALLDPVLTRRDETVATYRNEQDYLAATAATTGVDVTYWPQSWIVSFKYHLRQPLGLDRLRPPRAAPSGAKVIVFHGRPRPIDLIHPPRGNWDVFPHYGRGPVAWMRDYWVRNGGTA